MNKIYDPSSFRDPDGYVYFEGQECFRSVNQSYKNTYDLFISSGLYHRLLREKLILPFEVVDNDNHLEGIYKVLKPERLNFISYPYEWCFEHFKDTALICLEIQRISLEYGLTLKDATPYNFQLYESKPVLIDTLSFDIYQEGEPWLPYYQFCKNFLTPLYLMSRVDTSLVRILITQISGIPLSIPAKMFLVKDRLNINLYFHLKLHHKFETKVIKSNKITISNKKFSKTATLSLIDSLFSSVSNLKLQQQKTLWNEYYSDDKYLNKKYLAEKKEKISALISKINFNTAVDLGANDGFFSRELNQYCGQVISLDFDHNAINVNYTTAKRSKINNLHPLYVDIFNPSPAIGWLNKERTSLISRISGELVCALGLIHHLVVNNNLSFQMLAEFFGKISTKYLLLEYVPKDDANTELILVNKKDVYLGYTTENFEKSFSKVFSVVEKISLYNSKRIIYLFEKNRN